MSYEVQQKIIGLVGIVKVDISNGFLSWYYFL